MESTRPTQPDRRHPRRPERGSHAHAGTRARARIRARGPLVLAMEVIRRANRENPADAVLRAVLRDEPGLERDAGAEVARLVFGFYRWNGLEDPGSPLRQRVEATAARASAFAQSPENVSDAELERVVPEWIGGQVEGGATWRRALQMEPRLWLRARPGTGSILALELGGCGIPYPELLPDALWYQGSQDLFRSPTFQTGRFEVQDLASQAVGLACAPAPGGSWWDACAGEGGKTLHLADLLGNRGVVWATDRAAWRLKRLRMRAARAGLFNIRWAAWDGQARPPVGSGLDGVLVDAPCSGVGTWQRNPHGRWTLTPEDVQELAGVQLGLLQQAAARVRPGGMLMYAVCTLTRAETIEVARRFAETAAGFEPVEIGEPWRRGQGSAPAHEGWIWPQDRGSNGMFVARWRRA